jgi:hypothetical protein
LLEDNPSCDEQRINHGRLQVPLVAVLILRRISFNCVNKYGEITCTEPLLSKRVPYVHTEQYKPVASLKQSLFPLSVKTDSLHKGNFMSTGLECHFEEIAPGTWYYLLENDDAPKMAWDWREYATAYGPFPSEDAANDHLARHHPNPGGYSVTQVADRTEPLDAVLTQCIAKAITPTASSAPYVTQRYTYFSR